MVYVPQTDLVMFTNDQLLKHLEGMHDQTSHGRKGPIAAGFENWNSKIPKLIQSAESIDSTRGNALQATIIEAAGFNGKPQILSQAEFDALEGETLYRGLTNQGFIEDYKSSIVQYAGTGSYGNGTYATNKKEETALYTNAETKSAQDALTMELKLLPEANIKTFETPLEMKNWRQNLSDEFVSQYKASGKNPAEVQDVQWNLATTNDWTNIAIMSGLDAVKFRPFDNADQYYTLIFNRGKVVINGKS